ncbi:hypothetical protein LA080_011413 [Diaporthe eres]|nr:hypothetical protein LA080_011413 [Diaporthe eres]
MPLKDGNPEESRYCKGGCKQLMENCRCHPVHSAGPPDTDPNAPQNRGRGGGGGGQNTGGQGTGGQNTGGRR